MTLATLRQFLDVYKLIIVQVPKHICTSLMFLSLPFNYRSLYYIKPNLRTDKPLQSWCEIYITPVSLVFLWLPVVVKAFEVREYVFKAAHEFRSCFL